MLTKLVQSALQNGYLSVESEGLIRQLVSFHNRSPADQDALERLWNAMQVGQVRREARCRVEPLQEILRSTTVSKHR